MTGLLVLALLTLLLLALAVIGSVWLLGWGVRLAIGRSNNSLFRLSWPMAFLLFPGFAQLAYALQHPVSPRFRAVAAAVSLLLVLLPILTWALTALAKRAGLPT